MPRPRKPLPESTKQLVLTEAGYKCAIPVCRNTLTLQMHHIHWVRDGGGDDPSNLLALCGHCHDLHTQGYISDGAIRTWKAMLVSLNSTNRGGADDLILLHRLGQLEYANALVWTTDSVLRLAPLINAGLVEANHRISSSGGGGFPAYSAFRVQLTERGRQLAEAWMAGDEARLDEFVRTPNVTGTSEG